MRFLVTEKLGPHKFKTPEGYLICTDAILSRTGKQEYKRCEIFGDACDEPDKIVSVDRVDAEVFSDKAMASFENKPICIEHPDQDVNIENHNELAVGFVRDIHKGEDNGHPVMMGTLVITNKDAVEAVESGEYKELSCGYDCDIDDDDNPQQRNIRGNHVALCKQGRAGIARIVDSVNDMAVMRFEFSTNLAAFERAIINNDITEFNAMLLTFEKDIDDYNTWKQENKLSSADIGKVKRQVDKINSLLAKSKINKKFEVKDMATLYDGQFDKTTKQGFRVLEMYRDGGRLHVIFKRANDYGIGLGYDTADGQWAQGMYDYSTLNEAREALKETKPYARRIQDSVNDDTWSNVEEENYEKANKALMKDKQFVRSSSGEIYVFKFRGKYEVDVYNRNDLDYNALQQIANKFNVNLRRGNYGYVTIISENKDAIYKAFAAINPAYGVGSWRIEDDVVKDNGYKDEVEKNFKIYLRNIFGLYKIIDWPAVSKEAAVKEFLELNPEYRNKGVIEARDSVNDSKKEQLFTVEYEQNGVTYIRKIKADSLQDAIKYIKANVTDEFNANTLKSKPFNAAIDLLKRNGFEIKFTGVSHDPAGSYTNRSNRSAFLEATNPKTFERVLVYAPVSGRIANVTNVTSEVSEVTLFKYKNEEELRRYTLHK